MIYVYKCDNSHVTEENFGMGKQPAEIKCESCRSIAKRFYAGERKQTALSACRREQDSSLVLPTAKTFEGPGDPDGSKGMQKWLNDFEPTPDNKRPQMPSMPAGTKKSYLTAASAKKEKK